jgi:hypothetical protein
MQARMVEQLAEAVVRKARENKIIKGNKYVYRKSILSSINSSSMLKESSMGDVKDCSRFVPLFTGPIWSL